MRIRTTIAIALLALAYTLGSVAGAHASTSTPISDYVSAVVGEHVTVICERLPEGMNGYTLQDADGTFRPEIHLSTSTCVGVRALLQHRLIDTWRQSAALETLIHETYHLRLQSGDEGLVECTTMHNLWNYITPLGFSARANHLLYVRAWEDHWNTPIEYQSQCEQAPLDIVGFEETGFTHPYPHEGTHY